MQRCRDTEMQSRKVAKSQSNFASLVLCPFATLFIIAMLAGCSGGIADVAVGDYDTLIKSGWDEYNRNKFTEANQLFVRAKDADAAKPEAYVGSGWSQLRLQQPYNAVVTFRDAFTYITSLYDSVDALCGLSGSYLAAGENANVINLFKKYKISSYDEAFPFGKHDFSINKGDLEIVQTMAFYRLGMYSSAEQADPDNATYHLNQALYTPYTYTDAQSLMEKITTYLEQSEKTYYKW